MGAPAFRKAGGVGEEVSGLDKDRGGRDREGDGFVLGSTRHGRLGVSEVVKEEEEKEVDESVD